jgi:hypothetical protein
MFPLGEKSDLNLSCNAELVFFQVCGPPNWTFRMLISISQFLWFPGNFSDLSGIRMSLNRQSMQVSYNRLKNPSKNLWCNRQAKRDRQKLVNLVVPDKSEKFPGSQRNWDMEISIQKVQFGDQHTWKNTSSDGSVGLRLSDFFWT